MQQVLGYSALRTGLAYLPLGWGTTGAASALTWRSFRLVRAGETTLRSAKIMILT